MAVRSDTQKNDTCADPRHAFLGLGGNLGDVKTSMHQALKKLTKGGTISIVRCSSIYETPPWGMTDQPAFLNTCAEISTALPPEKLLDACLNVEKTLKRQRNARQPRWGPRTIDVDILLLEEGEYNSPRLQVPHGRILERAFVLVPLAEIAPDIVLEGKSIARWRRECDDKGVRKIAGSEFFKDILTTPA